MLANLLRDEMTVPAVQRRFGAYRGWLAAAADILVQGRGLRGTARRRVAAVAGHAVAFPTWRSLTGEQGLSDREAVELMCRLVNAAGGNRA
jgi:hypothetical protein